MTAVTTTVSFASGTAVAIGAVTSLVRPLTVAIGGIVASVPTPAAAVTSGSAVGNGSAVAVGNGSAVAVGMGVYVGGTIAAVGRSLSSA